jgi:hypothetical protein
MNKLNNSFALGLALGLGLSLILLVVLDGIFFLIKKLNGHALLEADVVFAICILGSLLLTRKFFKTSDKQELGKGFLFSAFIWGAAYVFLFHISPIRTIFFGC